jgi:transposase
MSESMNQDRVFEVLTAAPVRTRRRPRDWSVDEKARLISQTLLPGANVSAIARSAGVDPSQLYGWRRQALAFGAVKRLARISISCASSSSEYPASSPERRGLQRPSRTPPPQPANPADPHSPHQCGRSGEAWSNEPLHAFKGRKARAIKSIDALSGLTAYASGDGCARDRGQASPAYRWHHRQPERQNHRKWRDFWV